MKLPPRSEELEAEKATCSNNTRANDTFFLPQISSSSSGKYYNCASHVVIVFRWNSFERSDWRTVITNVGEMRGKFDLVFFFFPPAALTFVSIYVLGVCGSVLFNFSEFQQKKGTRSDRPKFVERDGCMLIAFFVHFQSPPSHGAFMGVVQVKYGWLESRESSFGWKCCLL